MLTGIKIDLQKPQLYTASFNEHRNTLQDSRFNFMDLAEPLEINFLNFDETVEESKVVEGIGKHFSVMIKISSKVFI